jgi:hypothetical protein
MTTSSDRLRAVALLLVAFVCGGAVGVAADRAFSLRRADVMVGSERRESRVRPSGGVEAEQIPTPLERLDLTPEEQRRLHAIARRWRPQAAEAIAKIRPIVSDLENDMFAEMLCVLSRDKQDRYLRGLRDGGADSAMIAKRFRLVRTNQCPQESADPHGQ